MPDRKPKREVDEGAHAPKSCAACGRTMEWRKSWAKNWDTVKFCSDKCRSGKHDAHAKDLEQTILRLLDERGSGKTICPSEAARAIAASDEREAWEPLMEPARAAARRLVAQGVIDVTQHGHVIDGSTAKGPIRLKRRGN
ncbi:DUF3253 domain-containing protein [Granulicella cerasi]|uniref:DUF3253 domain-containing protein n=1 Tax=Granulicella cerasi TaxID=741063 RepID=A0ABW1ZBG0_9BACT|nr:DUF2256 and DUF3253 domain-containing protein [Granulicella cerasi]